ncbi:MarR family winged helix-turn-helix transcriptional regulator [Maritalea sp.]|uniref:MarR family winged helix-turn-helix transcriptional regulator n=1 Tax=Maritalea sp. TaxID=2003361 RepID=UPI003EF573F7
MQTKKAEMPKDQSFSDDYLLYLLAQASAAASGEFHAYLAQEGMSVPKWRILASLYPDKQQRVGQLARQCMQKQPTLTRILDRMEEDGLVLRLHSKENRREVNISLTDIGKELANKFVKRAHAHENSVLAEYSETEARALKDALKVLTRRSANSP